MALKTINRRTRKWRWIIRPLEYLNQLTLLQGRTKNSYQHECAFVLSVCILESTLHSTNFDVYDTPIKLQPKLHTRTFKTKILQWLYRISSHRENICNMHHTMFNKYWCASYNSRNPIDWLWCNWLVCEQKSIWQLD